MLKYLSFLIILATSLNSFAESFKDRLPPVDAKTNLKLRAARIAALDAIEKLEAKGDFKYNDASLRKMTIAVLQCDVEFYDGPWAVQPMVFRRFFKRKFYEQGYSMWAKLQLHEAWMQDPKISEEVKVTLMLDGLAQIAKAGDYLLCTAVPEGFEFFMDEYKDHEPIPPRK